MCTVGGLTYFYSIVIDLYLFNCHITIIACREWSQCLEREKPFVRGSQAQKKFVHFMNEWKCSVVSPSRLWFWKIFWLLCRQMKKLQVRLCSVHSLFAPSLSFTHKIFLEQLFCITDVAWPGLHRCAEPRLFSENSCISEVTLLASIWVEYGSA